MEASDTTQKINNKISLKSLSRTPSGNIYHNDLKNIFSVLLFCLDLKSEVKKSPSSNLIKFSFKKQYPYSFTIEKAIDTMANLHIDLQYNSTLTKLSYEINSKFAFELLQLFYKAKLLHCPDDKTCKKILNNKKYLLQPTPKGVAILHQFCIKKGLPNIQNILLPEILNSNFNSMQLMEFERHSRTDSIIHSERSDKLLFIRIMGPTINIWSPKVGPIPITLLGKNLSNILSNSKNHIYGTKENDTVNNPLENELTFFEYLKQRQNDQINPFNCNDQVSIPLESTSINENDNLEEKKTYSPFYHRFFTNPDSDSHTQYYESNRGLRFFSEKQVLINGKEKIIKNCFSGKSLIQFLMDCTDVMYPKEALKVATIFLRLKLIECKTIPPNQIIDIFIESKKYLYSLTDAGYQLVKWDSEVNSNVSIEQSSSAKIDDIQITKLTLELTLKDPGLKYLFRKFMLNNMCVENLDIYDEIIDFQKKMKILMKMLSLKDREKKKYFTELKSVDLSKDPDFIQLQTNFLKHKKLTIYTAMNKISEYCLSEAYNIFTMYISDDAPNEINVDSKLRLSVKSLIEKKDELDSPCLDISELKNKINLYIANNYDKDTVNENKMNNSEKLELLNDNNSISNNENKENIILTEEHNNDSNQNKPNISHNLTLKLKNLRHIDDPPMISPTDAVFGPKLMFLKELAVLYETIRQKVYRMMETDSFGKFLESNELKENYCFL